MSAITTAVVTQAQNFPAGTVAGVFRFTVLDSAGDVVQTQDSNELTATFVIPSAGDYTVVVKRLDASGVQLGPVASHTFTVAAPDVSVDVPASITVTFQ